MDKQNKIPGFDKEVDSIKVSQETLPNFKKMINEIDDKKRIIISDREMVDYNDNEFTQFSLIK